MMRLLGLARIIPNYLVIFCLCLAGTAGLSQGTDSSGPDELLLKDYHPQSIYQITFRILETADEHFYAQDFFTYHWPLNGLALSNAILEKVYQKNAARILAHHNSD